MTAIPCRFSGRFCLPALLWLGLAAAGAEETAPGRLAGDAAGLRPALARHGVEVALDYTAEVFAVADGGLRRGATAQGLVNLTIDADLESSFGWSATTAHANAYDTHGRGISEHDAGDFGHLSNIEFADSARLFECWIERAWPERGWSVRAGQLALDAEFAVVAPAAVFCHSDFGACGAMSANVPVPIFAVAAPGLRLRRGTPGGWFTQVAVYDGNPAPDFLGDPSPGFIAGTKFNRHGWRVKLSDSEGALVIAETGRAAADDGRAPGWHAGVFYHTDTFSDQRFDTSGRALADPAGDGRPRGHRGNYGAYAVVEGAFWRRETARLDGFLRVAAVPDDRNLIGASAETGVAASGLVPGRPGDVVALGVAALEWSRSARGAVRDANRWSGGAEPEPDREIVVELTWRIAAGAAWTLQPDVQWIRHPGGSGAIDDALAVGLRTHLDF